MQGDNERTREYELIADELEAWRSVSGDLDDFIYYNEDSVYPSER